MLCLIFVEILGKKSKTNSFITFIFSSRITNRMFGPYGLGRSISLAYKCNIFRERYFAIKGNIVRQLSLWMIMLDTSTCNILKLKMCCFKIYRIQISLLAHVKKYPKAPNYTPKYKIHLIYRILHMFITYMKIQQSV